MLFRAENKTGSESNRKNSLQAKANDPPIPKAKMFFGGKVSSGASPRGSLTVESAFVLPIFFLCICTLICFMDIYRLQTEKLSKLCQQVKELGMYAYLTGAEGDIEIPSVYTYRLPVSIVPFPDLIMTNRVKVHPWTGYHGGADTSDAEEMVYVTETGGVCHLSADCTYLDLSIHQTPGASVGGLRNRYGERYHPCENCSEGEAPGEIVYVTDAGNRYHNAASCSGLKRTVRLVKKSQVPHLRLCSRCGGSH